MRLRKQDHQPGDENQQQLPECPIGVQHIQTTEYRPPQPEQPILGDKGHRKRGQADIDQTLLAVLCGQRIDHQQQAADSHDDQLGKNGQ